MIIKDRIEKKQKGVILVISVMMLSILMGLSTSLLSNSLFGTMFARNNQGQMLAETAVTYATIVAKQKITDHWGIGMSKCTAAPCICPPSPIPCVWQNIAAFNVDFTAQSTAFWNNYATAVALPDPQIAASAQSIIIDLGCDSISSANLFRIITRGVGNTANAIAYSDVTFPMPLNSQNVSASAPTYLVRGRMDGITMSSVQTPLSTTHSLYIPPGPATFITNVNQCDATHLAYAECQLNCAGLVRVMAITYDSNCVYTYGEWSQTVSQVILPQNGSNHTFDCRF